MVKSFLNAILDVRTIIARTIHLQVCGGDHHCQQSVPC